MLTDGYLFGCVTEILVDPDFQGRGIGRDLMEKLFAVSPTSIFLGAQLGNEGFFSLIAREFPRINEVGRTSYREFVQGLVNDDVADRDILYYDVSFEPI